MTKEDERKKIVEAMVEKNDIQEMVKKLEKEGFIVKHSAKENKAKKKANI